MTEPRTVEHPVRQGTQGNTKPKRPRRWMPMSSRSVSRSLRGEKTQAIAPLREFPWAAALQTGDTIDLRAKKNAQIRSLEVEIVRACPHAAIDEIPSCAEHDPAALAPWSPDWARIVNVSRSARYPEQADERDQAGWVVLTYLALNEIRIPQKKRRRTTRS